MGNGTEFEDDWSNYQYNWLDDWNDYELFEKEYDNYLNEREKIKKQEERKEKLNKINEKM